LGCAKDRFIEIKKSTAQKIDFIKSGFCEATKLKTWIVFANHIKDRIISSPEINPV